MKRAATKVYLFIFSFAVLVTSCQKEISIELGQNGNGNGNGNGTGNTSIIGDYDFVGAIAHTSATVTFTDGGVSMKSITTSDYVSKNNTGTTKITATQIIGTNIAYDVDTTMNVKTYMDNVLFDDSDLPFVASIPPASNTSSYTKITNDSIAITGPYGFPSTPSGPVPTGTLGAKISWAGDTLIMKMSASFSQNITQGGIPATFNGSVIGISKLKRK